MIRISVDDSVMVVQNSCSIDPIGSRSGILMPSTLRQEMVLRTEFQPRMTVHLFLTAVMSDCIPAERFAEPLLDYASRLLVGMISE